jgi:hypothetical protein
VVTSFAVALISPAGPAERGIIQVVTGRWASSGSCWMCPTATRCRIASSGSVEVCVSPSGSMSRSRSTASQVLPVSTSMTRPAREKPELQ